MHRRFLILVLAVAGLGCQLTPAPALTPCPLPIVEQTEKILDIVPLGTHRDEAIKRLENEGIIGNFSAGDSQSTYYCDIWPQSEKLRWHINVVLLFDENGILYGTRPQLPNKIGNSERAGQNRATSTQEPESLVPLQ